MSRRRVESPRKCSRYKYLLSRACNLSRAHETHSHSHRRQQRAALKNSMTAASKGPPLAPLPPPWTDISVLQKALKQILNSQHLFNQRGGRNFRYCVPCEGVANSIANLQSSQTRLPPRHRPSVNMGAILLSSTDRAADKFLLKFWQML